MSRALEILLKNHFRVIVKVYVASFAHSYAKLVNGPADFEDELKIYEDLINSRAAEIYRAAAFGISGYSNMYRVLPRDSFDEFKLIYFLGRAIEHQLVALKLAKTTQIHMFAMIGLLDEALKNKGVFKPLLTGAMTHLIRFGHFVEELGQTGCYLIYKCSSTAPHDTASAA